MATAAAALPPGPKPIIPLANLVSLRRNPIRFLTRITERSTAKSSISSLARNRSFCLAIRTIFAMC